jgi:hypothetical protein
MELMAGGLQPDGEEVRPAAAAATAAAAAAAAAAPSSANEARNESEQGGDRVSSTVG